VPETRAFKWANDAATTLNGAIDDTVTTVVVTDGSVLPTVVAGEIFTLVLRNDAIGAFEVLNVTNRTGNTLTVERGAEGSNKWSWPTGTVITHSLTAAWFQAQGVTVIPLSQFRTSRPYPYEYVEAMNIFGVIRNGLDYFTTLDLMDIGGSVVSGVFNATGLVNYTDWPAEEMDISGSVLSGVFISTGLVNYTDWLAEEMDISGSIISGVYAVVLVQYTDWPAEEMDISGSIISGSFTTP